MLVKIVGEDAVQSRADARGVELAIAVANTGTTKAMVVMGIWALLEKGMFVSLEPQVLLQSVCLFSHPYSGCIIVCYIVLSHPVAWHQIVLYCVASHSVAPYLLPTARTLFLIGQRYHPLK